MMVLSLFIIGHMGLFFYNKIGSIISIVDLPTTNIIEPENFRYSPFVDWSEVFFFILNENQRAN
ncbi:hypothetical protein C3Y86_08175 [Streptococcus pneumoniae]|nr:hypothetical protein C3Y86_08175 [Streptococcus pneumoniae]